MSEKKTFLLIDGHAIIHRAYHAYPTTLKTKDGVLVNAVFGFTKILLEVLKKFNPEYVLCAFDSKGPTFRHKIFENYKANRKKPDEEMIVQEPIILDVLKSLNIPIIKIQGLEADDILGTSVNNSQVKDLSKIIVTGDQDLFQLIDDDISIYLSGSAFSQSKLYTAKEVKEKYGFGPDYILDYKALRGDPSDNIPGVKGVGDKGAKELIGEFGHLENILVNIDKIEKTRVKNKIEEDQDMAILSKELATIKTDAKIDFELSDTELKDFDTEEVKKKFMELQFKSLMKLIPESNNKSVIEKKENNIQIEYKLVESVEQIEDFISILAKQKIFAYDCETTGTDYLGSKVLGISFSWNTGEAYYLNLKSEDFTPKHVEGLRKIFVNENIKKIGHNLKFDAHLLRNDTAKEVKLNICLKNYYFDTMIAAYVLQGGGRGLGLKNLAFSELGMDMNELKDLWTDVDGFKDKKNYGSDEVQFFMLQTDTEDLYKYACADADATWRLYEKYVEEFRKEDNKDLKNLFHNIEMPVIEVLVEMERQGIRVDKKYLIELGKKFNSELNALSQKIYNFVGHEFNISSPKQVGEVLFDELNLPGGKKTKTGAWQTNESILRNLKDSSPIIEDLLEYRELSKLISTYVDSLIDEINSYTRKVHTNYNQSVVSTGRLSSSGPNLQNIPISSDRGMMIRKAFIADEGCKLIAFDISQQELRILAHMANEEELIKAYQNDVDVHKLTASKIFGKEINEVTSEERGKGKMLNFSLIYGITAYGLSSRLKVSVEEAQGYIDEFYSTYPGIKNFFDKVLLNAQEDGLVRTLFGRYRDATGLSSSNGRIQNSTRREVINFPIQGTASDIMKMAIRRCFDFINQDSLALELEAKLVLQIHDEFVFQVRDDSKKVEELGRKIIQVFQKTYELKVPTKIGMCIGSDWGELK